MIFVAQAVIEYANHAPTTAPFMVLTFRLALDAGVPILPIVLHSTHSRWPKGALSVRPGAVDAEVLPPVPTTDWRADDLHQHAEELRARFAKTLERGPRARGN